MSWTPAQYKRSAYKARRLEVLLATSPRTFEKLTITVADGDPPAEFRLFTAGKVATSKGEFLFDAEAAKSVMAAYGDQGNELMVDYDHASLSPLSLDPAQSGKAAGWFGLELRNGELWAVNVRWTEPAAEALRRREWRYMSPAFTTKGKRITSILNVALTNIPATKRLDPLMAANRSESKMDLAKLAAMLGLPEGATEADVLKKLGELMPPAGDETRDPKIDDEEKPAPAAASKVKTLSADEEMRVALKEIQESERIRSVKELLRETDRATSPVFEKLALKRTREEVEAWLSVLPEKPKQIKAPEVKKGEEAVELTSAEREVCRLIGTDPAEMLAHKKKLAAARAELTRAEGVV